MVFGFNFSPSSSRTTTEVGGTATLSMEGVVGDDIGATYTPTDNYEWVEGGGVKLLANTDGGFSTVNDYTARFVGDGFDVQKRMEERIPDSVFTLEAWILRTREYNEGVGGSGRRLLAFSGDGIPLVESSDVDQISWLQTSEGAMQVRWPVDDEGLNRLTQLRMNVMETVLPGTVEHVVIVVDLKSNEGYEWDGVGATGLTDQQVYAWYNGTRLSRTVFSDTGNGGNFTSTAPRWNNNNPRLLGIGAPPWERTTSSTSGSDGDIWSRQFGADLYWVAMYDRALSDQEVEHLYSLGPQPVCVNEDEEDDDSSSDEVDDDGPNVLSWLVPGLGAVAALAVAGAVLAGRRGKSGGAGGDAESQALQRAAGGRAPVKTSTRKHSPTKRRGENRPISAASEYSVQTTASSVAPRIRRNPDGSFVE